MLELFTDRVTIARASTAKSPTGEVTQRFAPAHVGVPSLVQSRSGSQRPGEHGEVVTVTAKAYFLPGVDVHPGDHLIRGTEKYLVLFVGDKQGHHLEADLTSVRNE